MSDNAEQEVQYHIDLGWYEDSGRSFVAIARGRLCSACQEGFGTDEGSAAAILESIRDCCSKKPGFATPQMPILELLFRIFLANGNKPLILDEIGQKVRELREGNFSLSSEVLRRLLDHPQYYGLKQVPPEAANDTQQV